MYILNIGKKLREVRQNKKLSVYKLSKLSDVSENYIHELEKGISQPSVYILEKVLKPLGITLVEFFNEGADVIYPTNFEKELIHAVRILPEEKANAVLNIANLLS